MSHTPTDDLDPAGLEAVSRRAEPYAWQLVDNYAKMAVDYPRPSFIRLSQELKTAVLARTEAIISAWEAHKAAALPVCDDPLLDVLLTLEWFDTNTSGLPVYHARNAAQTLRAYIAARPDRAAAEKMREKIASCFEKLPAIANAIRSIPLPGDAPEDQP